MSSLNKLIPFLLLLVIFTSCKKSVTENLEQHKVRYTDSLIKINQAITLIDTDWIIDSIHYWESRPGRLYRWKSIPDNGCVTFSGRHETGLATATFACSGSYIISADIYDEAGMQKLATTIPVQIQVNSQTLEPVVAIDKQDTLLIRARASSRTGPLFVPGVTPVTTRHISLYFNTARQYDHSTTTGFRIDSTSASGQLNLLFDNKLELTSYPFAQSTVGPIEGMARIDDVQIGVPTSVKIIWLEKEYSGIITLVSDFGVEFALEQSGAVKITN